MTEFIEGNKAQPTIPIIDRENPATNRFHLTDELEVLSAAGTGNRRRTSSAS